MSNNKKIIIVPFEDNAYAKEYGLKFDMRTKLWYDDGKTKIQCGFHLYVKMEKARKKYEKLIKVNIMNDEEIKAYNNCKKLKDIKNYNLSDRVYEIIFNYLIHYEEE